ncbi:hypothetical protein IT575_02640 [bacterium]|nr:hypothetical protein [bacterium]
MSYRPPARNRGESALSRRRSQRRQEQARLVAMLLLLGLLLAIIVFSIMGIRSCAASRRLVQAESPRRTAPKGAVGKQPQSTPAADSEAGSGKDKPAAAADKKSSPARSAALKQLARRRYKPAPFAMVHDGKNLYLAQEHSSFSLFGAPRKEHANLYQLDSLSCTALGGKRKSWEAALDASFSEMGLAAGNLVLFNPYEAYPMKPSEKRRASQAAELPPNLGLMLTAYNSADGHLAWNQSIAGAVDASVAMDSKAVVVAYRDSTATPAALPMGSGPAGGAPTDTTTQLASQLRLAAFNARTGDKAWFGQPALKSLQTDQLEQNSEGLKLEVKCWEGLTVYTCYNVAGLLHSGTGDSIATYTAPGYIYALAYDVTVKTLYLLHAASRPEVYELTAIPIGGKRTPKAATVTTFEAASDHLLLLAEGGFVAVAHQVRVAASQQQKAQAVSEGQLSTQLLCFQSGRGNALVNHRFASGSAIDIAPVPGAAGEFMVALAASLDEQGQPRGNGTLYRARSQDGSVWEVTGRREPVVWLMPYKNECLLLYKGGQIQRFIPESNSCLDLVRAAFDYLEPLPGRARTPAVISSYPVGYLLGKSGQQMQVLVFE